MSAEQVLGDKDAEIVALREALAELEAKYDRLAAFAERTAGASPPPRRV